MVNNIFEYIGVRVKIANPWIDAFSVNCVELPVKEAGKIVKHVVNFEGYEKQDFGISDISGTGFYIKIDPVFVYAEQRRLSSSQQEFLVTVNFRLLFFSIESPVQRRKIVIENILSNNLRQMSFLEYGGGERQLKLILVKTNTNAVAIFKEETGLELESGKDTLFVSVDGKITFLSTNQTCEQECGISTSENLLQAYDFCRPEIFAQLSEVQKVCIAEQLNFKFKEIKGIIGAIDGVNTIFTAPQKITQIFKDGVLLFKDHPSGYTLSADELTATLVVPPNPAFDNVLQFFGTFN